jgi:hypothetical protein
MNWLLVTVLLAAASAQTSEWPLVPDVPVPPVRPAKVAPYVPEVNADSSFPMRVHLLTARWGGIANVYHGYGSGNLLDGVSVEGFDYGFQCDVPFIENETPEQNYQARWRRSPYQLEILVRQLGSNERPRMCTLRLAVREHAFDATNTARMSHGVSSSLHVRWQDPDFAYEPKQPEYPVHFHVLNGQRREDSYGDYGWGTANLTDPLAANGVEGADYSFDCSYGFLTNSQSTGFYQGRWVQQNSELEVLLQRPGSDKVDKCVVKVQIKPQPYEERRPHSQAKSKAVSRTGSAL